MEFLYEPYFLSLVVAFISTCVYYLYERNKRKSTEEDSIQKKELSPELKSILVFIISYCIFTGLFYAIKNYLYPKGNITLSEEIISEESTSFIEKAQQYIPSLALPTITIPSLFSESTTETKNEMNEIRREKHHKDRHLQRTVDETLIAGKKKSPIKDKDTLKYMNSKEAKFADHDVEYDLKAFDL